MTQMETVSYSNLQRERGITLRRVVSTIKKKKSTHIQKIIPDKRNEIY